MSVHDNGVQRRGFPWRLIGWSFAGAILLLPAVAMQFTPEVNWTASDFVFAAVLIAMVGLGLELAARSGSLAYRGGAAIAIGLSFLLVWINGAVGIIGSEQEDVNFLFLGVIAVAGAGAVIGGFKPAGMMRAMLAAAAAQVAVPLVASTMVLQTTDRVWAPEVVGVTVVFTSLWLMAAGLFRQAAAR